MRPKCLIDFSTVLQVTLNPIQSISPHMEACYFQTLSINLIMNINKWKPVKSEHLCLNNWSFGVFIHQKWYFSVEQWVIMNNEFLYFLYFLSVIVSDHESCAV